MIHTNNVPYRKKISGKQENYQSLNGTFKHTLQGSMEVKTKLYSIKKLLT